MNPQPSQSTLIGRQRLVALQNFFKEEAASWLFVLKTLIAALIALWLAYRLELESPKTAVVTVFIVMQARTGMVLAKGFYRALGTIIGSGVALLLVAAFAQERVMFLIGLAIWVGMLTAGATIYRNFQSYAFVLAGYTACLVGLPAAMDPNAAFDIAVTRLTEVLLGILVASTISGLVFPLSIRELLLSAALKRFATFANSSGRALSFGVPTEEWGSLHLKAINEIVTLDSYRSVGIFDNPKTRLQNQTILRMSADLIAAASTLHVLNRHILRLNDPSMNAVREALDPLLATGVRLLQTHVPTSAFEAQQLMSYIGEWQAEIQKHKSRIQAENTFSPEQQLAFDTALMLLEQFLDEFRHYGRSHSALQDARIIEDDDQAPPLIQHGRHATDFSQPLIAGLRTVLILGVMSVFWINSAWPTGVLALTIAVVVSALFSTAPNPAKMVFQLWQGIALSFVAAFAFQFTVLPNLHGFTQLTFGLIPFLAFGAYLMTRPKWGAIGVGFGLFFSTLAIPDNVTQFNYAGLLNSGIALLVSATIAALAFLTVMPMGNQLSRYRMMRALNRQLIVACLNPLTGLRPQFERDTRELLRQIAGMRGFNTAKDRATLTDALTIQELGSAVLELRTLLGQPHSLDAARLSSVQTAISALARFYRHRNQRNLRALRQAFDNVIPQVFDQVFDNKGKEPTSNDRKIQIYLHLIQQQVQALPDIGRPADPAPEVSKEVAGYAA
ncbi:MAG: FUSC family protein [Halothiobacillus sp.]